MSELNLYEEHLLRYQSWIEAVIFEQGEEKLNEILQDAKTVSSNKDTADYMDKAFRDLAALNLNADQYYNYSNQIGHASSIEEIDQILEAAKQVANENDLQDQFEEHKQQKLDDLNNLNLTQGQNDEFTTKITNAQTIDEVDELFNQAKSLSDEADQLNEYKKSAKHSIIDKVQFFTSEAIYTYLATVDNAQSVEEIDQILEDVDKAYEENYAQAVSLAIEEAKEYMRGLDLTEQQINDFSTQLDSAKTLYDVQTIRNASIEQHTKNQQEAAEKLE